MILPRTPLDAYRADLATAGVVQFGAADATWLLLAELVSRHPAKRRVPDRGEAGSHTGDGGDPEAAFHAGLSRVLARPAGDLDRTGVAASVPLLADGPGAPRFDDVHASVAAAAEQMEERGALQLAYALLAALVTGTAQTMEPRRRGLVTAQRARVARKLGATDASEVLYAKAGRIGRATHDDDLVVRAYLGRAVLARQRGNYPASNHLYRRALRIAERCHASQLAGLAHHGLAIAASTAGDAETALRHGWDALERFEGDVGRQGDVLAMLAGVAAEAGYFRPALHAYLAAAERSPTLRVRLPVLSGAAICAAHLGDGARLSAITEALAPGIARDAFPYERAQALLLLAEAWALYRPDTCGEPYRTQAADLAAQHNYHEVALAAEQLERAAQGKAQRAPRGARIAGSDARASTRRVLAALADLDVSAAQPAGVGG